MGIWTFEDWDNDSPYIHGPNDIIGPSVNNPEQVKVFTQVNIASMATLAIPDIVVNVNEYNSSYKIYPNPTTGMLRVTSDELQVTSDKLQVEIFDVYGRKCHASHITRHENDIDVSHLPAGIYFIKIENEFAGKFVKE
jgi:hypothetical protein